MKQVNIKIVKKEIDFSKYSAKEILDYVYNMTEAETEQMSCCGLPIDYDKYFQNALYNRFVEIRNKLKVASVV